MSDQPHPDAVSSPVEKLGRLLQEVGAEVKIGLRAQGHLPTVERMLAEGKSWAEIGKAIGWNGDAAARWFAHEKPSSPVEGVEARPSTAASFRAGLKAGRAERFAEQEAALAQALQAQKALRKEIERVRDLLILDSSTGLRRDRRTLELLDQCLALTRQTEKDQEDVARVDTMGDGTHSPTAPSKGVDS